MDAVDVIEIGADGGFDIPVTTQYTLGVQDDGDEAVVSEQTSQLNYKHIQSQDRRMVSI